MNTRLFILFIAFFLPVILVIGLALIFKGGKIPGFGRPIQGEGANASRGLVDGQGLLGSLDSEEAARIEEELRWYLKAREILLERSIEALDSHDLLFQAIQGMTRTLPYAEFYTQEDFARETTGEYVGLGLHLRMEDGKVRVYRKAFNAVDGLQHLAPGDLILAVDSRPVQGMSLKEVYQLLRGDYRPGDPCTLQWMDAMTGVGREETFLRERITAPSVHGLEMLDETRGIGYLWIHKFLTHTPAEFQAQVEEGIRSAGLKALILDLRFNSGGVLQSALSCANKFITEGVMLTTRGRAPLSETLYRARRDRCVFPELKLVVLVNGHTISAAEVLAGILQDFGRARLVGSRTFGKGVVQNAVEADFFGKPVVLKLPTALYILPSGRSIDKRLSAELGIAPDLTVSLDPDRFEARKSFFYDTGKSHDPQLSGDTWKEGLFPDPQLEAALEILQEGDSLAPPGVK